MKIKSIEPIAVSLPMLKPVIMAGEEIRRADNVLVRIETAPVGVDTPEDLENARRLMAERGFRR